MTPEFSRLIPIDRVPEAGLDERIEADGEERAALAERLALPEIRRLEGDFHLVPWRRGRIRVRGMISAEVVQICVLSLDSFPVDLTFTTERFFIAGGGHMEHVEELEGDEPDLVSGDAIDIGELAAEELALNLDPYPKKPGAELAANQGLVQPENEEGERSSPFEALRSLVPPKDGGE